MGLRFIWICLEWVYALWVTMQLYYLHWSPVNLDRFIHIEYNVFFKSDKKTSYLTNSNNNIFPTVDRNRPHSTSCAENLYIPASVTKYKIKISWKFFCIRKKIWKFHIFYILKPIQTSKILLIFPRKINYLQIVFSTIYALSMFSPAIINLKYKTEFDY